MVNANTFITGLALALTASAIPVEQQTANCKTTMVTSTTPAAATPTTASLEQSKNLTAAQLIQIAPTTETCTATGQYASECAPASRAAPAIANSFTKYGITTPGAQAALIALMLYETANFTYSIHHFPSDNPGQGTRNMQSANFNIKYAQTLQPQKAASATASNVLSFLTDDDASFGSAAWFVTTQCDKSILSGLADGSSTGWDAYLTKCIYTSHDAGRDTAWTAAKKVLGA